MSKSKTTNQYVVCNPGNEAEGVHVISVGTKQWCPGDAWDGLESAIDDLVASGHLKAAKEDTSNG